MRLKALDFWLLFFLICEGASKSVAGGFGKGPALKKEEGEVNYKQVAGWGISTELY